MGVTFGTYPVCSYFLSMQRANLVAKLDRMYM